jgi:hypothetical protein
MAQECRVRLILKGEDVSCKRKRPLTVNMEVLNSLQKKRKSKWVLSHYLNKEILGMSWYKNHLTSGQMAFAISRSLRVEDMSYAKIVRAAHRHMAFLNMMRKGHLKIDTKMRMFWDYVGDLYEGSDLIEFVFMRGKHDVVSGSALRLSLSFACFMLTESDLNLEEYVQCFFGHEECTVQLEKIDPTFNNDSYDIYDIFKSFFPYVDESMKEKRSIDMWGVLCDFTLIL